VSKAIGLLVLLAIALGGCTDAQPTGDDDPTATADGKADGYAGWTGSWFMGSWNDKEDKGFANWIRKLGTARANGECSTLASCLRSRNANSLYSNEDASFQVYADCADLPYVLRAYYSYKRTLPFSFMSAINGTHYTAGNTPQSRSTWLDYQSLPQLLDAISENVHSGFYRMGPEVEDNDHYPIAINRDAVKPGTVFYDPNGHLLVVYAVEDDGTVRMIDSHPDNSLTVQRFGSEFARGSAAQGGGFRGWRYQSYSWGQLSVAPNADAHHPYFSVEQYQQSPASFYDWVRTRLSLSGSRRDVAREYPELVRGVCGDIRDRVGSVSQCIAAGIHQQPHPATLPENIYGTTGDWETYASPSRDARLRASVRELYRFIKESSDAIRAGNQTQYVYNGTGAQLAQYYRSTWSTLGTGECRISYQSSQGQAIDLNLDDVMARLFDLSFDPYHCPELRWGAHPDKVPAEFASCPDSPDKITWYRDEYRLRNIIDRPADGATTLDSGPAQPENINIPALLQSLR
jgi:hypothetical protein